MRSEFGWSTALLVALLCGCGTTDDTTTGGCTPRSTAAVAIAATGVTPKAVCVLPTGMVTFTNGDTVPHDIQSGVACPQLNLGAIAASASVTATFPTAATCPFHDELDPTNVAFQGTVAVSSGPVIGPGY